MTLQLFTILFVNLVAEGKAFLNRRLLSLDVKYFDAFM